MKKMIVKIKNREIILYIIFGVLTTIVNYITYYFFTRGLLFTSLFANLIAWCISVLFAYLTNKLYVFKSKTVNSTQVLRELLLFISARLLSGLFDLAFVYIFVEVVGVADLPIKIFSNIIVIVGNWMISKMIIFNPKKS
ncbi:MAG: GtrA family protein [Culicoidibacterales bacterium]